MRLPELTLRSRFLAAVLGLSAVLILGFALAIFQFLEVLEADLLGAEFSARFAHFVDDYARLGEVRVPPVAGFSAYFVPGNGPRDLPGDVPGDVPGFLRALDLGVHHEIVHAERDYHVGIGAVDGGRLYLVQDLTLEPVEILEHRLLGIATWAGVSAALLSLALSLWLSHRVTGPVQRLAQAMTAIVPGERRAALPDGGHVAELRMIARTLGDTMDRFDEFAARERQFTRDASHELRTPLAVVLSSAQLLEGEVTPGTASALRLARLRAAAEQMQALLAALLLLAREPGEPAEVATVSIVAAIEEAVRIQRSARGAALPAVHIEVSADRQLEAPRGLLLCVLNNLLGNAMDHAGATTITIGLRDDVLIIEDDGRGIDAELGQRAFEPAVRGPRSAGLGLGLDLVRRICARLGWTLAMDTPVGGGTRFELGLRTTSVA